MNKSIKIKLISLILTSITIGLLVVGFTSYIKAKQELDSIGKIIIENSVIQAGEFIKEKVISVQAGDVTLEQAQNSLKEYLIGPIDTEGKRKITNAIDIGENGYFYVLDSEGTLLAHPSLEGQNLWDKEDFSKKKTKFIQEQIKVAKNGGGYSYYDWPFPNSTKTGQKVTYVTYIPEWDWILANSTYLADFNEPAEAILQNLIIALIIVVIISGLAVYFVTTKITDNIVMVRDSLEAISQGDFSYGELKINTRDEVGVLSRAYNVLYNSLKKIAEDINLASAKVNESSHQLTKISEESARSIDEISNVVNELANGATQQAMDTESGAQVSVSLSEIISSDANEMSGLMDRALILKKMKDEGLEIIEHLSNQSKESNISIAQMREILDRSNSSTKK